MPGHGVRGAAAQSGGDAVPVAFVETCGGAEPQAAAKAARVKKRLKSKLQSTQNGWTVTSKRPLPRELLQKVFQFLDMTRSPT